MGLFSLDGPFARVNREAVLLLAGPRALLLQLAHPLVAQGVADHSGFLADPLGRLRRTLDAMLTIVFGDEAEARASAAAIRAVHERVHGTLAEATGRFAAGTPYDARDPELALWVHATLVDSARVAFECFVEPLGEAETERYYQESKTVAALLEVPEAEMPADHAAFRTWYEALLAGPVLEVTPTAARLADAVLHPPIPLLPRALGDAASVVTVGLLPASIRERFALSWDPTRDAAWRAARALVRGALPLLPDLARTMPHARRAQRQAR